MKRTIDDIYTDIERKQNAIQEYKTSTEAIKKEIAEIKINANKEISFTDFTGRWFKLYDNAFVCVLSVQINKNLIEFNLLNLMFIQDGLLDGTINVRISTSYFTAHNVSSFIDKHSLLSDADYEKIKYYTNEDFLSQFKKEK